MKILVTGGTGSLGRPTVALLTAAGHEVRTLSRRNGQDLSTSAGLADVFGDIDTVLHLATAANAKDIAQTANALEAAKAAGITHFIYISIVGVDSVPYPYYRAKFACEQLIEQSGLPHTILRATQFHGFMAMFITMQRRLPVILAVDAPDQPIAVEEVAERLTELVAAGPSGRVADVGGPEQLRLLDVIAIWQAAAGTHKPVWMIPLFGKTIRAFKEGRHMTPLPGFGRETFAEFAAKSAAAREGAR